MQKLGPKRKINWAFNVFIVPNFFKFNFENVKKQFKRVQSCANIQATSIGMNTGSFENLSNVLVTIYKGYDSWWLD